MYCQSCNEHLPLSARTCFACGALVARSTDAPAVAGQDAPAPGPARISTPTGALPQRVRVGQPTPLLDRPFASARRIVALQPGQWLVVHSGQLGFYGVETPDGRRGFVDQQAVSAGEPVPLAEPVFPYQAPRPAPEPPQPAAAAPAPSLQLWTVASEAPHEEEDAEPDVVTRIRRSVSEQPVEPAAPQADPADVTPIKSDLPFNIPMLEKERIRYRAVFLYNPDEDQQLVVTNRRLIVTGGTIGRLPRVLHLDEIEAVRLQDSGTGSTNGEGHLFINVTGIPGALHVGGVHMPHHVRNEILSAATEARTVPRSEAPTVVIRRRKSG